MVDGERRARRRDADRNSRKRLPWTPKRHPPPRSDTPGSPAREPSCSARTAAGLVEARDGGGADAAPRDRVVVVGGGAETLGMLRMASVRTDDVLLVTAHLDGPARRLADLYGFEAREGEASDADIAGASALLVATGDRGRENAAVRAARRRGIPVHVAGRPLVSDFTLLDLVERRTGRDTR